MQDKIYKGEQFENRIHIICHHQFFLEEGGGGRGGGEGWGLRTKKMRKCSENLPVHIIKPLWEP